MNRDSYRIGKVFIAITNPREVIKRIEDEIRKGGSKYICVSNPRTVVLANKNRDYQQVMNNSLMNIPDAEPMVWAARAWGLKNVQRTMGPMLFTDMVCNPHSGIRHFLLGDTEDTLRQIREKCEREHDSLIAGTLSPPFATIDEYDYKAYAETINASQADIVWLALRAPKQDFFAARLAPYLDSKICIGVGAAFRFYLGEYKMSHPIIKKLGLMGLFWGKKNQRVFPFVWGYITDNAPFLVMLAQIYLRRMLGKRHWE